LKLSLGFVLLSKVCPCLVPSLTFCTKAYVARRWFKKVPNMGQDVFNSHALL
jgi:hypothetical protein